MSNLVNPARHSLAAVPSDTVDNTDTQSTGNPTFTCRGISVGVAGVVAYKDDKGITRTTGLLAAGMIHPIQTKRIMSTGTTATGVVLYW